MLAAASTVLALSLLSACGGGAASGTTAAGTTAAQAAAETKAAETKASGKKTKVSDAILDYCIGLQ